MAAKWLYSVDQEGVRVAPEFMGRLRNGDKSALRALNAQKLTALYLKSFTRAPRRKDAHGLFWSDIPDTALIPRVEAGRHQPHARIRDSLAVLDRRGSARKLKGSVKLVAAMQRERTNGQRVFAKTDKRNNLTAWYMTANPKFDLVVVNRHDRAALLKLLGDLDATVNVERWLEDRTIRQGATASSALHADYTAWCAQGGEAPAGSKNFAQSLVTAGVVKLTRGNAGERYQLELR